MTVSYQYEVASSTSGGFTRLLFMWRGSLYKLIYRELLLFLILFGAISALYRHAFTPAQKKEFEQIVIYCDTFIKLIPLSFVLGFYVSYVAQRWWKQYKAIPWPDKVMHLTALYVTGSDEYGRMLRRSLMRYLNVSLILVLRSISSAVKRRFPTLDHVVDSGFMTPLERQLFESVPSVEFNTYWIPCTWFVNLLKEARRSHRLPDPQGLKLIMEEFNEFRTKCGLLWSYDWVSIPLVYTQVVTLATYSFFGVALVGRQYIEGAEKQFQLKIDIYLPIFTILQFFFFMGLLKVAEQLINPFGDDDEDFELNWLIDRHTKVSYLGVDTLLNRCPPLVKDIYFDSENLILPYTEASVAYKRKTYRGSVANMMVPEEKQTMFLPDIVEEEEYTRETPTPRTSTISLASHMNENFSEDRRQISGSPQTTSLARNSPETILQMDIQESPELEQPEQRKIILEAVRRFSALAKSPGPKPEGNRKTFYPRGKTPKVFLQPWPNSTNLSRPSRHIFDTPMVSDLEVTPWRDHPSPKLFNTATRQIPNTPIITEPETTPEGFVNSGFLQERLEDRRESVCSQDICHCNAENRDDNTHSDVCQHQCRHGEVCQHPTDDEESTMQPGSEKICTLKLENNPRYVVRRNRSLGESLRRKGVRWKQMKLRRRTADNVPIPVKEELLQEGVSGVQQAKSSPNLRDVEIEPRSSIISDVPDDEKVDSVTKNENITKL